MSVDAAPILEMRHITKTFPGVVALNDISLAVQPGQVHAIVGENGAGKSTLMKVLAGVVAPDSGEIALRGHLVQFAGPGDSQQRGISIIYQEFNLLPYLSVAENIFLGREPHKTLGLIDWARMHREARESLARLSVQLDPTTPVANLSVAQQQEVEIAKALSLEANIIVMDEPTAVLAAHEVEHLFDIVKTLKSQGVTVIYISHRLAELYQIADQATVIKDGRVVGAFEMGDVTRADLIRMMVGRPLEETFPAADDESGPVVLSVRGLSTEFLDTINFELRSGEILGLAGLVGAGRTSLARALFGASRITSGDIKVAGKPFNPASPRAAIRARIALVPEERKTQGLVLDLSIRKNMSLPILARLRRWGLLSKPRERTLVNDAIRDLGVRTPSAEQEVQYLSGGNQQKVVLAKWLNTAPQVLILDEPTRGVDVGAKAEIYGLIREIARKGTGILFISSELPEVLGMSDRIMVMRDGRIEGEVSRDEATEEKILGLATGESAEALVG